jgi:hypothetical protein
VTQVGQSDRPRVGAAVALRRRPAAAAARAASIGLRVVAARRPKLLGSATRLLGRGCGGNDDARVRSGGVSGELSREAADWLAKGVVPQGLVPLLGAPILPDADGRFPSPASASADAPRTADRPEALPLETDPSPPAATSRPSAPSAPAAGGTRVARGVIIERPAGDDQPAATAHAPVLDAEVPPDPRSQDAPPPRPPRLRVAVDSESPSDADARSTSTAGSARPGPEALARHVTSPAATAAVPPPAGRAANERAKRPGSEPGVASHAAPVPPAGGTALAAESSTVPAPVAGRGRSAEAIAARAVEHVGRPSAAAPSIPDRQAGTRRSIPDRPPGAGRGREAGGSSTARRAESAARPVLPSSATPVSRSPASPPAASPAEPAAVAGSRGDASIAATDASAQAGPATSAVARRTAAPGVAAVSEQARDATASGSPVRSSTVDRSPVDGRGETPETPAGGGTSATSPDAVGAGSAARPESSARAWPVLPALPSSVPDRPRMPAAGAPAAVLAASKSPVATSRPAPVAASASAGETSADATSAGATSADADSPHVQVPAASPHVRAPAGSPHVQVPAASPHVQVPAGSPRSPVATGPRRAAAATGGSSAPAPAPAHSALARSPSRGASVSPGAVSPDAGRASRSHSEGVVAGSAAPATPSRQQQPSSFPASSVPLVARRVPGQQLAVTGSSAALAPVTTLGRATRAVAVEGVERAPEQAGRPSPAGIGPVGARAREKAPTDLAGTPSGSAPPSAEAASGSAGPVVIGRTAEQRSHVAAAPSAVAAVSTQAGDQAAASAGLPVSSRSSGAPAPGSAAAGAATSSVSVPAQSATAPPSRSADLGRASSVDLGRASSVDLGRASSVDLGPAKSADPAPSPSGPASVSATAARGSSRPASVARSAAARRASEPSGLSVDGAPTPHAGTPSASELSGLSAGGAPAPRDGAPSASVPLAVARREHAASPHDRAAVAVSDVVESTAPRGEPGARAGRPAGVAQAAAGVSASAGGPGQPAAGSRLASIPPPVAQGEARATAGGSPLAPPPGPQGRRPVPAELVRSSDPPRAPVVAAADLPRALAGAASDPLRAPVVAAADPSRALAGAAADPLRTPVVAAADPSRALAGTAADPPRRLARVPVADLAALQSRARALSRPVPDADGSSHPSAAPPPPAVKPRAAGRSSQRPADRTGTVDGGPSIPTAARGRAPVPPLARQGVGSTTAGGELPRPQLVPAPSQRRHATAAAGPAGASSGSPRLQRQEGSDGAAIDAAMLASLTGGTLAEAGPASSTVSFLARAADPPPAPAATVTTAPAGPPDTISVEGEARPLRIDELYDRIVKRLRRELLDDRERRGRLIGEGRW